MLKSNSVCGAAILSLELRMGHYTFILSKSSSTEQHSSHGFLCFKCGGNLWSISWHSFPYPKGELHCLEKAIGVILYWSCVTQTSSICRQVPFTICNKTCLLQRNGADLSIDPVIWSFSMSVTCVSTFEMTFWFNIKLDLSHSSKYMHTSHSRKHITLPIIQPQESKRAYTNMRGLKSFNNAQTGR